MEICQIWYRANWRTFQDPDIKFPELSRTYTDFQKQSVARALNPTYSLTHLLSDSLSQSDLYEMHHRCISMHTIVTVIANAYSY